MLCNMSLPPKDIKDKLMKQISIKVCWFGVLISNVSNREYDNMRTVYLLYLTQSNTRVK